MYFSDRLDASRNFVKKSYQNFEGNFDRNFDRVPYSVH